MCNLFTSTIMMRTPPSFLSQLRPWQIRSNQDANDIRMSANDISALTSSSNGRQVDSELMLCIIVRRSPAAPPSVSLPLAANEQSPVPVRIAQNVSRIEPLAFFEVLGDPSAPRPRHLPNHFVVWRLPGINLQQYHTGNYRYLSSLPLLGCSLVPTESTAAEPRALGECPFQRL